MGKFVILQFLTEKFAKDKSVQAIWFAGKVTVNGTMYNTEKEDYSDAIIFEKSVKAKNIVSGGTSLYFLDKVESQVLYVQIQSEGLLSFKQNTENAFQIRVDDNQIWKKNKERFDFGEDGEEITAENLDKFLLNKDAFFVIDEDYENEEEDDKTVHYYNLEEEDELFVEAIISGKEIFNLK